MFKRFLSMFLALIMVTGIFPVSVFATEEETPVVDEKILHEQITVNCRGLEVNVGRSTEGILVIGVPESVTDEDLENAYIGDGLNCSFVEYLISAPAAFENAKEIKFCDFWGSDVSEMENIEIEDSWWNIYEEGELVPGNNVILATKDSNGNIVREQSGETVSDYGIAWLVDDEIYYQKLRIVREMPVISEEDEEVFPPESTPVANQKLTVRYVEGSTCKGILAEADIVDGKVEITVPYITDNEVKAIEADGSGRKRARLAFCISDGYDDENITHFMGGFGENIMDYVNWEEVFELMKQDVPGITYEEFLIIQYWEIEQLGEESVVKYEVARDTDGKMRRWIEAGGTFSERLYIQYFDSVNKEAVAYEHIDVTLHVEDICPAETEKMPFGQVELNGYKLNSEEIGYIIGVNDNTNELVVEMSREQLLAKESTKDQYGNINNRFEFSAPSEGNYKYIMAVGEEEILNIKNFGAEDFVNEYNPENKPAINFVVGWFEDGEFYRAFEEDKKTSVCFAWYDGTEIVYQSFKLCQCMLIEDDEINWDKLSSWEGNFAEPSDVVLEINGVSDISNFASGAYVDGIYTVTVDAEAITKEQWERIYSNDNRGIFAAIGLKAPEGTEYAVDDAAENPEYYEDYSASRSNIGGFYPYNEEVAYNFYTYLEFGSMQEENGNVEVWLEEETWICYYQIAYYIPASETFEYRLLPCRIIVEGAGNGISFEIPENGGNSEQRKYLPDGFHDYWDESELITSGQIEVTAHSAIRNYLDAEFNDEGVLVITVNDIPAENWELAYNDLPADEYGINVNIEIDPPNGNIVAIADNQGNGPTYENLKNQYAEDRDQIIYHNHEGIVTGSLPVGEVLVDGKEVSVFPSSSGGVFYRVIFWKDAEGNVIQQILPFVVEVADDAESVTFDNGRSYISEDRIEKDGRTSVLSGSYDREKGVLKYSYIGTKTSDADIADDIRFGYGEDDPVYKIQTRISAPEEGYVTSEGEDFVVFNLGYDSPENPLRGSRGTFEIEWFHESKEPINEVITIEFNPGKIWMDKYWTPISDSSRLIYYSITNGYELMSAKDVRDAGVILDLFQKPGKIYTRFDEILKIDIEKIANLEAWVLPPDAAERNADESLNDWVERVYRETEYVGTKVGATGVGEYELGRADMLDQFVRSMNMLEIGRGSEAANIAGFGELGVDNLRIWFASNSMSRNGHVITIDWYKEGETEPSVREYLYNEQESLVVRETADSITENELTAEVEVPTPVDDNEWVLTTNHFAQVSRFGEVKSYYFQLEGDENTPEGDKVIYLPYSFVNPFNEYDDNKDGIFDYSDAVKVKLNPKIHHYDNDHRELETVQGELTPYGIRFVVSSFSPFVLDWSEDEEVANSGKNIHPETAVFAVPESLEDYIETSYNPEEGILTVNVKKAPAEAWKAAYENIGLEDTAIGGDVIITAPEGTVKERRDMGGIDFDEFTEWASDPDSPLFNELYPELPYSYSFGEFAHVNRTGGAVIITPEKEDFDVAVAWQDANKNIVHQIIHIEMTVEEGSVKFDDPFANIKSADVSRIDFMGGDSELFSPYKSENVLNYENGLLTYTYIGTGTNPDEIREDILYESENYYADMRITVFSPKENYYLVRLESQRKRREYDVSEKLTNANLNSEFKNFGELVFETEKYNIYWQNSEAPYDKIVETVSITYDVGFEIRWMDKYWDPVDYSETNTNRIDIIAEKNGEYQEIGNSEVENAGVNLEWNNGHFDVTYDKNVDIGIAKDMIAYITPPANAVYYIENGSGGMNIGVGDILTAEDQNDLLNVKRENGEFIRYGNGNVPCINLSWFELGSIEDLGIDFWYTSNSGYIQIEVIDWFDKDYNLIKREYIYVTYGEYVNEEEAEATPGVKEEVTVPTPIGQGWKLTTNHFPQVSRYEEVTSYYFQLEGDENTPDGEKVIYLPYSFIDPEGAKDQNDDGIFDYADALALELNPKIHHYNDDHDELVEGEPLNGELTEYGIRFVVESFSPFVLDWSKTDMESWEGNIAEESEVSLKIKGISDISGFVSGEYVDGIYTVTVTPENITTEQWQQMYKNVVIDQQDIYLWVGVNAPAGTTKAYDNSRDGLKNYNDFVEETGNANAFYDYNDERAIEFYFTAPLAGTVKNGETITAFPEGDDFEGYYQIAFYVGESNEIVRRLLPFRIVFEGDVESVSFEEPRNYVPEERLHPENNIDNIVSSYDEINGDLVYIYSGNENNAENIAAALEGKLIKTVIDAPVVDGKQYYSDGKTSVEIYYEPVKNGDLYTAVNKEEIIWENEDGEQYIEYISLEFNPKVTYMDIYWEQITDTDRINFVNKKGETVTAEALAKDGLNVSFDENGFVVAEYELDLDPETVTRTWVKISKPEGEFVGYKTINFMQNFTGYPSYDLETADYRDEDIREAEFQQIGNGTVLGMLGELDSLEVGDLTFWYANEQGASRPVLIDWYKKLPTDPDFDFEKDVVREYVYVQGSDFVFEETANSVTEDELTAEVEVPTPVDDIEWKLTTNHFPQVSRYEEVTSYYFQLEGDENTPDGKKVIYLPYSFVNPYDKYDFDNDGDFDYSDAVALKLNPKIHHYNDDFEESETINGELTPYGIRFVVSSFSPFVLDWSESGNSAVIGENGYATLGEALEEAKAGDVIELVANVEETMVLVSDEVTLDLNGYTLATEYASIFGDIADNSDDNSGRLVVNEKHFMSNPDNAQLPVKTETGYAFVELKMFVAKDYTVGEKHYDVVFEPRFEADSVELLKNNLENAGVEIAIVAHWQKDGMPRSQRFVFVQNLTDVFFSSYNTEKEKFGKMFTLKVNNAPEGISYETVVNSTVGVVIRENATETVN
ncbi:MAG: hypothetical protein IKK14_02815 [Oscillospiraceae bacterium]|nr:hypothetical protein [Oscillospiraceae bacterium]